MGMEISYLRRDECVIRYVCLESRASIVVDGANGARDPLFLDIAIAKERALPLRQLMATEAGQSNS